VLDAAAGKIDREQATRQLRKLARKLGLISPQSFSETQRNGVAIHSGNSWDCPKGAA
jgi:phage terminase small subunit